MEAVRNALEARPWRPEDGPAPRVWLYPYGRRPALRIRVAGRWRHCLVHARQDYPDGRTAYQVEIALSASSDGIVGTYIRTYWWPAAMRPTADSRPDTGQAARGR
ncbi:hypothetical protein DVA86_20395 [Streptomyces armeniacus]|uniref:Uncharacterized protein n=1 Tax=Streptomyces armeniacus TaxID=83291 RepID=A0A345XSP0_9ACTN|nr:hypothetical protein [Streptomyces armeniacus]AXK34656.1 hypothetical protein DVA86_20395 [Streptomyces armeniacus]